MDNHSQGPLNGNGEGGQASRPVQPASKPFAPPSETQIPKPQPVFQSQAGAAAPKAPTPPVPATPMRPAPTFTAQEIPSYQPQMPPSDLHRMGALPRMPLEQATPIPIDALYVRKKRKWWLLIPILLFLVAAGISAYYLLPGYAERKAYVDRVASQVLGQADDAAAGTPTPSEEPAAPAFAETTPEPADGAVIAAGQTLTPQDTPMMPEDTPGWAEVTPEITPAPTPSTQFVDDIQTAFPSDGVFPFETLPPVTDVTPDPAKGDKVCFITFDDGPSKLTPQYLEILRQHNVKATFFVLGSKVKEYPNYTRDIYNDGHLLANHSYTHDRKSMYKNDEAMLDEIYKTEDILKETIGDGYESKRVFRFPGGSTGPAKPYRSVVERAGVRWFDWNVLNGDAQLKGEITSDRLYDYMKSTYENARKSEVVVLMHDTNTKTHTLGMLDRALTFFEQQGYLFDTMDHATFKSK